MVTRSFNRPAAGQGMLYFWRLRTEGGGGENRVPAGLVASYRPLRARREAPVWASQNQAILGFHPCFSSLRHAAMITLYSYPELFGVADNNGYGLKVFAFLRLAGVPFTQHHIFDASAAPRGQLPYIDDDGEAIGDSDTIIAHLTRKYRLTIDDELTAAQRDTDLMIARMLDDLYWVMSYSRWKDEQS